MDNTAALLTERGKTHGNYKQRAALTLDLKLLLRGHLVDLEAYQIDAIEMILLKLSRIAIGDAQEPDHWDDIAGYARLGRPTPVNDM